MPALALLLVVAASPRPMGAWRDGPNVILVTETADPNVYTVTSYFNDADPGVPATWDEKSRTLSWGDAALVVSPDGKSLSPTRTISGKKVEKPAVFKKLTGDQADKLPEEKAQRALHGEAKQQLQALYTAETSEFAATDAYGADLKALGFAPPACADGTRALAKAGEIGGCLYVYRVTLSGKQFTGTATGVGAAQGITLTVSSVDRGETKRGMIRVEK